MHTAYLAQKVGRYAPYLFLELAAVERMLEPFDQRVELLGQLLAGSPLEHMDRFAEDSAANRRTWGRLDQHQATSSGSAGAGRAGSQVRRSSGSSIRIRSPVLRCIHGGCVM